MGITKLFFWINIWAVISVFLVKVENLYVAWYDIIQFVYLSPLVSDIELEPDIKNAFVFNNEETAKIVAQSCGGEVLPMDKNIC